MSEQFYCCVFSYIGLELPPVQLRLHGSCSIVRCSRTDRLYRSTYCSWWTLLVLIDRLFQRSIILRCTASTLHTTSSSLSERLPVDASTDVPVTYCLSTSLFDSPWTSQPMFLESFLNRLLFLGDPTAWDCRLCVRCRCTDRLYRPMHCPR